MALPFVSKQHRKTGFIVGSIIHWQIVPLALKFPSFKDQIRATFYVFIELLHLIRSKMPKYKFPHNVKDIPLTFSYSFVGTPTHSTDRTWDFDARIRRLLRCLSHTRFHVCSQSAQRWKKSSEERGGVLSTYGHICPFPGTRLAQQS
jgi:hypothetical protein